jgi:hypothetical protein
VPSEEDWQRAEAALGIRLPSDYKHYLSTYGSGRVDGFLDIFNPAATEQWENLLARLAEQRDVFADMQRGSHPIRYDLFPASPGLLPIGQTDNGDMVFYLADGDAETWTIALLPARGRDVQVYPGSLSAFLVAAIRHQVEGFPAEFASPPLRPARTRRSGSVDRRGRCR